jgi:hypothetical protein
MSRAGDEVARTSSVAKLKSTFLRHGELPTDGKPEERREAAASA